MLFLDGVYIDDPKGGQRFLSNPSLQKDDIIKLNHTISLRIGHYLERAGFIECDAESSYLTESALSNTEMGEHQSHSINYRIAMGHKKGKHVFKLQTIPAFIDEIEVAELVSNVSFFSLHAGVLIKANQRDKLERLCRYIARPAISNHRLSITENGKIQYELKTPDPALRRDDGTTHILFEPLDFISKLVAQVPLPRINLTRFHGVFASHSKYREQVINRKISTKKIDTDTQTEGEKRGAMNWARRLKRAFQIDMEICERCGGNVKVIAFIEDPAVIKKIMDHLNLKPEKNQLLLPITRAPPMKACN